MESREGPEVTEVRVLVQFGTFQVGLGPSPGWGPYGPIGPSWAHKGPYGPIRALMGPIWVKKLIILIKNHTIINKDVKVVNLEILKVKAWFGDKDLFS